MKKLTRFNLSARLETVKGFLDEPDTLTAVLYMDETSKGSWVRHGNAENYANNRVAEVQRNMIQSNKAVLEKLDNLLRWANVIDRNIGDIKSGANVNSSEIWYAHDALENLVGVAKQIKKDLQGIENADS
ncbi:hypothetical protein [Pseudomonas phage Astolliot]|nr:hypothetical protein [Pseudomonas phage Astolliot]